MIRSEAKTDLQSRLTDPGTSAIAKYREAVIGRPGALPLLRHEVMTGLLGGLPGALGLWLRRALYPRLAGYCGRGVVFGKGMTLRHAHKLFLGDGCLFDDGVVLDAKGEDNGGIRLGAAVMLGRGTILACKGGMIEIGDNTNLGILNLVHSETLVRMGRNVLVASFCYIVGGGRHDFDRIDVPIIQQGSTSRGVVIEDNVWIGANSTILDGVTIGRDSVIGAGAVVNQDIPAFTIAAGIPARVVRDRR